MKARPVFPVKPAALVALAPLVGCITVSGSCGVAIENADGKRSARVECDQGGAATIVAPARTIEAVNARTSESAP